MKKKLKIIVPALILCAIAGIWIYKDSETKANTERTNQLSADVSDPNFAFETDAIDLENYKSYGMPIMIDFGSEDCAPCRAMKPELEQIYSDYLGKAFVKYIDVWEHPSGATDFPISVIPTQMFWNADGSPYVPSDSIGIEFIRYDNSETGEHIYTAHRGGLTYEQMSKILAEMGA